MPGRNSLNRCTAFKLVIKEEALPLKEQPEFPALAELAKRGLLAPDTWSCKRAQISLKATIDVPMLGTIIEQNGDGLLEQSHMPVGWPLHIDGAVRQSCAVKKRRAQICGQIQRFIKISTELRRQTRTSTTHTKQAQRV